MSNILYTWYRRYFSDPEAIVLIVTLLFFVFLFWLFGTILAPLLVSIVIAYLLDGLVKSFRRTRLPHIVAVSLTTILFIGFVLILLLLLLPLLWQQLTNLFNELPNIVLKTQSLLSTLPEQYPSLVSHAQINAATNSLKSEIGNYGKVIVSFSIASIPGVIQVIVYAVLVPLLVFFLLKDKATILNWLGQFAPKKSKVLTQVWAEVNTQIANYVRGRILEMLIVSIVTAVTFKIFGLQYALLLGALVGIATIIPYIGAVVATIPVVIIAFVQWGWGAHFAYLIIAYTIISILDSNVLVPLLFSGTMNLHPVAIIVAVVFFGGLWGFWGLFFAIPLATVVNATIKAWPKRSIVQDNSSQMGDH